MRRVLTLAAIIAAIVVVLTTAALSPNTFGLYPGAERADAEPQVVLDWDGKLVSPDRHGPMRT